jgi:hypothetical protein
VSYLGWLWVLPFVRNREEDLDQTPPCLEFGGGFRASYQSRGGRALWLLANRATLALQDRNAAKNIPVLGRPEPQVDLIKGGRPVGSKMS